MKKILVFLLLLSLLSFNVASVTKNPDATNGRYLLIGGSSNNDNVGTVILANDTWAYNSFSSTQPDFGTNELCGSPTPNSCNLESGWVLVFEQDDGICGGLCQDENEAGAYQGISGTPLNKPGRERNSVEKFEQLTIPVEDSTRKLRYPTDNDDEDGDCWNDPCAIMNTDISSSQSAIWDSDWKKFYSGGNDVGITNIQASENSYSLEGSLILGFGPNGGKGFFLCTPETEGKVVYTKPFTSEYLGRENPTQSHAKTSFECFSSAYESIWVPQTECTDGIDNDGDNRADTDPMCSDSNYEDNYPELSASTPVIPMVMDRQLVYYQSKTDLVRYTGVSATDVGGIADIDGTGKPEIIYLESQSDLKIYDADTKSSTLLKTGVFNAGPLVDIDNDGTYETFYEDSGDQIEVEVDSGSTSKFDSCGGLGIGPETADMDDDGKQEIFVDPRANMPVSSVITDGSGCDQLQDIMNSYRDDSSQVMAYPGGTGDVDSDGAPDISYQLMDLDQNAQSTDYIAYGDKNSYTNTGVEEETPGPVTDVDGDDSSEVVYATKKALKAYDPDTGSTKTVKSVRGLGSEEPGIQDLGGSWYKPGGGDCSAPVVGVRESNDEKVVFMEQNPGGQYKNKLTGCSYDSIDSTVETGQPDTFICDGDSAVENSATGDDSVTAAKDNYCQYNMDQREYPNIPDPQFRCSGNGDCSLGDFHNNSVNTTALAVKYYVPKEGIPVGDAANGFEGSNFATSNGFKNTRYDHIHRAEKDYLDGNSGDIYKDAYTHNQSKYDEINVSTGSAYSRPVDDTNETAIRQVWNPSNATGQYTGNVRNLDSEVLNKVQNGVNNTEVFNGGFYPSCETGLQWGYDDALGPTEKRWRCTGDIDWSFDVYSIEPSGTGQDDAAGFFVMPWEFTGSNLDPFTSYKEARGSDQNDKTEASIEAIRTVCWRGGLNNEPAFSSDTRGDDWFAKNATGIGDNPQVPVPFMGQLQLASSDNVYSCRIEFDNSQGQTIMAEGNLKVVSSAEVAEQQTRAQSILSGSYNSNLQDNWFNATKVCSKGSTCNLEDQGLIDKGDLSGSLISSQADRMGQMWRQNLSYSFSQMSSGSLSSYMKNGN